MACSKPIAGAIYYGGSTRGYKEVLRVEDHNKDYWWVDYMSGGVTNRGLWSKERSDDWEVLIEKPTMRIWNITPKLMCRQHLLGEHHELHMIVGAIKKGTNLQGYFDAQLIDTSIVSDRHREIVREMEKRGYHHASPLDYTDKLHRGKVVRNRSLPDLISRCGACSARYDMETMK